MVGEKQALNTLIPQEPITRNQFVKWGIKILSIFSISYVGINCGPSKVTPTLRGLSTEQYHNFNSIGEVFLEGNPFTFDLGYALDSYVFGHPGVIDTWPIIKDLADIPSSILASIALDFSLTPLVKLNLEDRRRRLLGWKNSSLKLKRGAYGIMRQTSFFLLSSNKDYQRFTGYEV